MGGADFGSCQIRAVLRYFLSPRLNSSLVRSGEIVHP